MPTCSVPYCINASGKDNRLTFHEFPHETPIFLKKWLENIGRPNWRPGHRSVVCCEHFQKDDFDRQGRLRIGSFPSKFPEPPFRKKKKLDTGPDAVDTSLIPPPKAETAARCKEPLPIEKKVSGSKVAKESQPAQDVTNVKGNSSMEKEPLSLRVGLTPSAMSKNVQNENRVEVKNQINSPSTDKMTEVSPRPPQVLEIPKKRKILEESQPISFNPGQVLSSYSLVSCRVCGQTNSSNINIFGTEGRKLCLAQLIKKCLPIEVLESESLPHCVCKTCIPRLRSCFELITTCEKTNNSFIGKETKQDADPPVIHSKPAQPLHASRGNRRVLLLEMSLNDGIPVKSMITQAIQELNLRLKPKELRETKPQGRIMFLDLQGGTEAFPEQMKKAISMLFPSSQGEKTPVEKKTIPSQVSTPSKQVVQPKPTSPHILSTERSSSTNQQAKVAGTGASVCTSVTQFPEIAVPNLSGVSSRTCIKSVVQPLFPSITGISTQTPTSLPPLIMNLSNVSSPSTTPNLIVQTSPMMSTVPLAVTSNASGPPSATAIRIAALPGSLAPGVVPQIMINVQPKPPAGEKATNESQVTAVPDNDDYDDHHYEDDPMPVFDSSSNSGDASIPPLVPIKLTQVSKEKFEQAVGTGAPAVDIAKLKDKVVTKINNVGKQIKLGDKIVGIVVRNSDSKNDVQRKLQATLSSQEVLKNDTKTTKRTILPKGSVSIPVFGAENIPSVDILGRKKLKERLTDVPSAVDKPSASFDRRNARKLSLSFMWRKTGFLVSSYQKLYTWKIATEDDGNIDPIITCRVCKFTTKTKSAIETHLMAHPELQCPICWKYFLTDAKVFEHMSVIHSISKPAEYTSRRKTFIAWRHNSLKRAPLKQYQCSRCDRRFKLKDGLKRHLGVCKERTPSEKVVSTSESNLHVCQVCNRSFSSSEALEDHASIHTKRTSWLCDICGMVLKSASNYRSHVARHDENAHEYKFQCNTCKKRFKLENRYEDHVKKHENRQSYICSSCGKNFNTLNGLRQHEILHGERKLQCRYCPSRFHRRDHLRIHEASHTKPKPIRSADGKIMPGTGRMFTCRFCVANKNTIVKFPNMRELMRHYSDSHALERGNIPGTKKFECDRCTKTFVNSTLLRHHHMWHAGLRPYSCSFCGAGFMIKERLRNHEMTHTNERPFKCQFCDKGFRSRNVLKQHKLIHNDPSQFYKCQFCDKSFSRIDNLRTHTRVHTGEKPWRCLHCQRQFRLRSECTKHVQTVHQVPIEEVLNNIETLSDPNNPGSSPSEPGSAESAIAAFTGIATVQDMELLVEAGDIDVHLQ